MTKKQRVGLEKDTTALRKNAYVKKLQQMGGKLDMVDGNQHNGQPKDMWYFLLQIQKEFKRLHDRTQTLHTSLSAAGASSVYLDTIRQRMPEITNYMIKIEEERFIVCGFWYHISEKYSGEIRQIRAEEVSGAPARIAKWLASIENYDNELRRGIDETRQMFVSLGASTGPWNSNGRWRWPFLNWLAVQPFGAAPADLQIDLLEDLDL